MVHVMLVLIIVSNLSYLAMAIRLRVKHNRLCERSEDGMLLLGSMRQVVRVVELIASGRHAALNDRILVTAGSVFIASFLINFPLMFFYALNN